LGAAATNRLIVEQSCLVRLLFCKNCLYNGPDNQPLPNEYASLFTSSGNETMDLSSFSSNGSTVGIEAGTEAKISPSGSAACKNEGSLVHIFVKQ